MKRLTDADRKRIDELRAEGKSISEIVKIIEEFSYTAIWQHVNLDYVLERAKKRYEEKQKEKITMPTGKYVPTGKIMPPTNPPKPMTIIVDKELAEVACREMGLGPPVTTLANRPHNISHHGMKYVDGKWIANQDVNNYGIVDYSGPSLRSNI